MLLCGFLGNLGSALVFPFLQRALPILEADLTDYIVGACILNKHCQFTSLAAVFGQRFRNIGKAGICYGILCVLGKELSLLLGNIS